MTDPQPGTPTDDSQDDAEKETTAVPADTEAETEDVQTEAVQTEDVQNDEADQADKSDEDEASPESDADEPVDIKRRINWKRVLTYGLLPGLALLLAMGAGFLKWQDSSVRDSETARIESVQFAKDSTVAMLSYRPDTVEKDLGAARDRLTGDFQNSYWQLVNDVVIPGAKQKLIAAVASVPAVASVSADANHAVALVFVNQTVIVGASAPTDSASAVKVTMDKIDGRWLISSFDPV